MLGSSLPVAVGAALKFKIKKEKNIAVAFFGEGAASRGDVHEAMNFAGVHKLPVLFVCENNRFAYSTPLEKQMAIENVADRAPRPMASRATWSRATICWRWSSCASA